MASDQDTTIKISGDASELKVAADQGAQSLNKLGAEAEKINKANPLESISRGANRALGPVTGLIGRIGGLAGQFTILVGIVTGAVAIFDKFANAAERAREKARVSAEATAKFAEELKKLSEVNTASDSPSKQAVELANRLDTLAEKYKKLREELSANDKITGTDRYRLQVELRRAEVIEFNKLNKAVESNNRLLTARDEGASQASQRKALREAIAAETQLRQQLEDERTNELGRIENERARKVAQIQERLYGEEDEQIRAAYERQIALVNDLYNVKYRKAQEAINKEAQEDRKRIEDTNRREQESIRQVAAAVRAASADTNATFQSNAEEYLRQIAAGIQTINSRQ